MCGVIGLVSEYHRKDLGIVAAELLKTLEYRGYDSTGAAIQRDDGSIVLRKGVGAPSVMVEKLGIVGLEGSILCGQVRWATFGSVDDANAQPHEVRCRTHIYGAHNGNVTNCDDLKTWLSSEGHDVLSDNDGEMVVHTVEHYFAAELEAKEAGNGDETGRRRDCMRAAILAAALRLKGSYAAVIVDPVSRTLWAIKQGSSLYFGIGRDVTGGGFAIASSDLSSILKLTRVLVPVSEGEFIEYTHGDYRLFAIRDYARFKRGDAIERSPVRSRLQAKDAALLPQFQFFMEQEIAAQVETCRLVESLFTGGSAAARRLGPSIDSASADDRKEVTRSLTALRDEYEDSRIRQRFRDLTGRAAWQRLVRCIPADVREAMADLPQSQFEQQLASGESALLVDLLLSAKTSEDVFSILLLDTLLERDELAEFAAAAARFVDICVDAQERGGRVFFVCCGSSHHAALAGAVFFNELARAEIVPILPGDFRGRFASSLRSTDVVVAVSQSGETKDLIDVMNHVIASGLPVRRLAIVNNVSSTLGLEKCETVLPLRCGPEIAVPATKSFINQLAMMYGLALALGRARMGRFALDAVGKLEWQRRLDEQGALFHSLPSLIDDTLKSTAPDVEEAAKLLFLRPSMHILATRMIAVAKEGALKIREVVLNHTEGFEASEFKHGPNTILGVGTIFGVDSVLRFAEAVRAARGDGDAATIAARDDLFGRLYADYPLVFVTGPDETDVNLTVSQINTHKIRGTSCVVIAEENAALRQAAAKPPADNPDYRSVYITLPATGDNLMVAFTATVVLQRLAFRMSVLKQQYLDAHGFKDHGVHPDVPKNVSKSITVD